MLRSDGNKKHQVQSGRMVTIYRLFHALPESNVVGQGKHTAFSPCCLYQPQTGETWKCEGKSQLCELQDIPMAHLRWFEGKCHFDGTAKGLQKNSVVSYANVIIVPKVVTTPRKTSLYINHIHLKQRMLYISLL